MRSINPVHLEWVKPKKASSRKQHAGTKEAYFVFIPFPSKEHNSQTLQQQDRTLHGDQYTSLTLQLFVTSAKTKGN